MLDKLGKAVSGLERINPLIRGVNVVGAGALLVMVLITFVDVFLRYLFRRPMGFCVELVELILILLVYLGIAYTQLHGRHVSIDAITSHLSYKARAVIHVIVSFLGVGIVSLLTWRAGVTTYDYFNEGVSTFMLRVPFFYFAGVMTFGFALLWVVMLRDFLKCLIEGLRLGLGAYRWLLVLGVSIVVIGGAALFALPFFEGDDFTLGLVSVGVLLVLFFAEIPIAFALSLVGVVFIAHFVGVTAMLDTVGRMAYVTVANYAVVCLPFFLLLGYLAFHSRFGGDLYYTAHKWIGREPGGLAMGTVVASSGLAAVVGDTVSATVAMGVIALPEMKRYGYHLGLSCGAIVAGGTIGTLIPPSIAFIIYGILTMQSIGKLFIAGILPGLLCAGVFMLYINLACRHNPGLGPRGPKSTWRTKLTSLRLTWPILLLILLVLGGIYGGIFTPTEAGAIGATGCLLIGLAMRRFSWKTFTAALHDTGLSTAMIFLIWVGAKLFTGELGVSGVTHILSETLAMSGLPRTVILMGVIAVLLFLGCIMPVIAVLLITVPIFYPIIVETLGYDPIWFGVLNVLMFNIGAMTPPFGMNLFVLKGVAKDISMETIIRGTLPFIILALIAVGLLIAFPQIATWLPNTLWALKG